MRNYNHPVVKPGQIWTHKKDLASTIQIVLVKDENYFECVRLTNQLPELVGEKIHFAIIDMLLVSFRLPINFNTIWDNINE